MHIERKSLHTLAQLKALPTPRSGLSGPGFATETQSTYAELPEGRALYVPMNAAYHTKVPAGEAGQVYTSGLAGCTGIAGVAHIAEGALTGVSHFDPMVEATMRRDGISPSEQFVRQFVRIARGLGSQSIRLVVAYSADMMGDARYGDRLGDFDNWHFLDQLESNVEEPEDDIHMELIPYVLDEEARRDWHRGTLAANVAVDSSVSVAFEFGP